MKKLTVALLFLFAVTVPAYGKSDGWFNVLQSPNDCAKTKPTNGQVLQWDSSAGLWKPTTPSASGGGHTIQDEGGSLAQRTNLNFVGAGVTATDGGAGPDSTIVTIPQQDLSSYLTAVTADSPLSGSGTSGSHLTISTAGTWAGNATTATTASTVTTNANLTGPITSVGNATAYAGSNAITATANAATVPINSRINTVTNNSAATLTITLTTTSATDGMLSEVRILDATAASQNITWVNTENSNGVAAPAATLGSTNLPLSVLYQYNGLSSKWRCIASS